MGTILAAVIICIVLIFALYLFINVMLPLRKIKDIVAKISEGKFDTIPAIDDSHSFGVFSSAFNAMYEELKKSREREIALKDKETEVYATLGRELTDPLTSIKLTSELLRTRLIAKKESEPDEYALEKLDLIYNRADQTGILLKNLLSNALDDMGEFEVVCSDTESRVLEDMVKKYDHRHVVTMTNIPYVLIHIDRRRIDQVIGNIIENSYKYANSPIDISFLLMDDYLQMKITDHGEGVPEDEIDLIMNRFYRGRKWADSPEEGNGLGLFMARMLMEKMDGKLFVENTGEGLCATLLIRLGGS